MKLYNYEFAIQVDANGNRYELKFMYYKKLRDLCVFNIIGDPSNEPKILIGFQR